MPTGTQTDDKGSSQDVQQLAKEILNNGKIKWMEGEHTRKPMEEAAAGNCSHTGIGGCVPLSGALISAMAATGRAMSYTVNSLTTGQHSSSASNHYKGTAIDTGCDHSYSAWLAIASKYGGHNNGETCGSTTHNHTDFPMTAGAGIAPGGVQGGASAGGGIDMAAVKAAIFATEFNFTSIEDQLLAQELTGVRSLMNDTPLFPFIEQLCQGSLRQFQSLPNGDFYAFFADYFGEWGQRDPYWQIFNIEILDGKIDLNDEALVTHQYVVGDVEPGTVGEQTVDIVDKLASAGVVSVFDAGLAQFINTPSVPTPTNTDNKNNPKLTDKDKKGKPLPPSDPDNPLFGNKEDVLQFLERYGARPNYFEAPFIRNQFFETFLAFQLFMLAWSRQFTTTFTFTFMPELFPGGIVAFPEHGIQCYIEEVHHQGDYENGFTTAANLSAPAAIGQGSNSPISRGMVRSLLNSDGSPIALHTPPRAEAR